MCEPPRKSIRTEAWLRGALGLGGSVTTLDQSGERLRDPDVPGARPGEEQAGATRAAKRRRPAWQGAGGGEGAWGRAVGPVCTRASPPPRSQDAEPSGRRSERDVTPGPPPPSPDCVASRPREGHAAEGAPSASTARGREALSKRYADPPLVSERPLSAAARLSPFRLAKCGGRRREGPGSPAGLRIRPRELPPARHGRQSGALNTATRREKRSWNDLARGTDFCPFWGRAGVLGEPATRGGVGGGGRLRRGTRELHPHRPGIHPRNRRNSFPPRNARGVLVRAALGTPFVNSTFSRLLGCRTRKRSSLW